MAIDLTDCIRKNQNMDAKTAVRINDMLNNYAANVGYSRGVDGDTILKELAREPNQLNAMAKRMELETLHDDGVVKNIIEDMKTTITQANKEEALGITTGQVKHINATKILNSYLEVDSRQVFSRVNVESVKDDFSGVVLGKIGQRLLEKFNRSFSKHDSQDLARALFKDKTATADANEYIANMKAGVKDALHKLLGDKPEKRAAIESEIDKAFENLQFDNRVEVVKLSEDEYVDAMKKYLKGGNGIEAKVRAKHQHYTQDIHGGVDYSITEDMAKKHTLDLTDFKSINAYVEYLTEFNKLTSVVAAIQNQLVTTAYKVGLYKIFGSNPQRTINKIFSAINEDPALNNIVKRSGGVNEAEIRGSMDILLGRDISIPAIMKFADAETYREKASLAVVKSINGLVNFNRKVLTKLKYAHDLGLSPLTQGLGDGQVLALGRTINNIPNNGTFSTHLRMLSNLDGETRKELLDMATPLDYYMSRHAAISAREGDNVFASRGVDMFTANVNTLNAFEKTGLAVFDAAALQANGDIAMNAAKKWNELIPEYQSFFLRNGWSEDKWNEMVNLGVKRTDKYSEMVIDDSKLSVELRDLYRATVINSAKFHSGRPTLHLRNLRYRLGGPVGSGKREIVDAFMYLNSFALTQAMNHIGNIIFNGGAGLKNIKYQNLAFLVAIGVSLHYTNFLIRHALVHGEVLDITQFGQDTKEGQTLKNGLYTAMSYGSGLGFVANWTTDSYTSYGADVKQDLARVLGTPQTQTAGYLNPFPMFSNNNLVGDIREVLFGDNITDEDKIARRNAWRGLSDFAGGYVPRSLYTTGALTIMADTELAKMKRDGITGWKESALAAIH